MGAGVVGAGGVSQNAAGDHERVVPMAEPAEPAQLTDLPYGTRQRIVVVPDDVLEAEPPALASPAAQRVPRRSLRGRTDEPLHPTLRALQAADEDALQLLPVRQSDIGRLDMPIGHPLPGVVYIGSPAVAERYYPAADFHARVFEERFGEAMRLLMALGAERLTVRSERGWQRDLIGSVDVPFQRAAKGQAKLRIGGRRDRSLVFDAELTPTSAPTVPTDLIWFHEEPTWKAIAEGRLERGLREFRLHVTSRENFGIGTEVAAKISKLKALSLGGEFTEQVNTSWLLEGTFGEMPKRGWMRGV